MGQRHPVPEARWSRAVIAGAARRFCKLILGFAAITVAASLAIGLPSGNSVSRSLSTGFYLVGCLALVLAALGYAGVAGGSALAATQVLLTGLTVAAVALLGRYLHRLLRESSRLRTYYIKEANVPLRPEDTLTRGRPGPPPPARA